MRSLIFDLKRSDQSNSFFLNGPNRVCPQLVSLVPDRLERKPRLGSEPRGGGRPSANPHLFLPSTTFETLFPTPVPTLYLRWRGLRGEKWSHYAGLLRPRLDGPDKVPLPPLMAVLKDVGKGEKRERGRERCWLIQSPPSALQVWGTNIRHPFEGFPWILPSALKTILKD